MKKNNILKKKKDLKKLSVILINQNNALEEELIETDILEGVNYDFKNDLVYAWISGCIVCGKTIKEANMNLFYLLVDAYDDISNQLAKRETNDRVGSKRK